MKKLYSLLVVPYVAKKTVDGVFACACFGGRQIARGYNGVKAAWTARGSKAVAAAPGATTDASAAK